AGHLGPDHEQAAVDVLLDGRVIGRRVETGPAAVGVELSLRLEQLGSAARTQVGAGRLGVPVLARERAFRSLLPQHVVLGWGQVPLPLRFALPHRLDLLHRSYFATIEAPP